mmetsp:Transcript_3115/g.3492  ORF Transcript_3115/g.3492 Transcript_3115/m.3492 type:complete len:94 (+) Transcript_3115:263-544(+)
MGDKSKPTKSTRAVKNRYLQWGMMVSLKIGMSDKAKARSPTAGYDFVNESHMYDVTTAKKASPVGLFDLWLNSKSLKVKGITKIIEKRLNTPT